MKVRKKFFCSKFPVIPENAGEKKKRGNYEALCFSSKTQQAVIIFV